MYLTQQSINKKWVILSGAIVVLLMGLVLYFILSREGLYYVVFGNVQYLNEGAEVIADEVLVGSVKRIDFIEGGNGEILVTLKIKSNVNLPDNSIARIGEHPFTHQKIVEISLQASDQYYQFGDTIKSFDFRLSLDSLIDLSRDVKALMENEKYKSPHEFSVVYSVQLFASSEDIKLDPANFKSLKGVHKYFEDGMFKYTFGKKDNIENAQKLKLQLRNMGYKDAFIVAFKGGKRISISEIQ
jgi:hypothetical protein